MRKVKGFLLIKAIPVVCSNSFQQKPNYARLIKLNFANRAPTGNADTFAVFIRPLPNISSDNWTALKNAANDSN